MSIPNGMAVTLFRFSRLARRENRNNVTAMPLGIDTVSLFGLVFGALGPVYAQTGDAELSWQVGMALMVFMGVFKLALTWPCQCQLEDAHEDHERHADLP